MHQKRCNIKKEGQTARTGTKNKNKNETAIKKQQREQEYETLKREQGHRQARDNALKTDGRWSACIAYPPCSRKSGAENSNTTLAASVPPPDAPARTIPESAPPFPAFQYGPPEAIIPCHNPDPKASIHRSRYAVERMQLTCSAET